ncbi:hypothetical protein [Mucilaginibacter sp. UR6-11]|nr:hypothetical protein [Mucilaginibacter sp. UR6-11]MCC8423608.1 hypothetical protein [Mucilaginibacter sp. UR6-11]
MGLLVFIGLSILVLIYANMHMIYNRIKKKDELDGLFHWFKKKNKKN